MEENQKYRTRALRLGFVFCRAAGCSEYFLDFSVALRIEIIKRAKHPEY
jgi:hypothetical protein